MTRYGVHTGLQKTTVDELIDLWHRIESWGFDWISIWDHFYSADLTGDAHCLEAVAAHTALPCLTTPVRCRSLVYGAGCRHAPVLGKAISTIDHYLNVRTDGGLGGGGIQLDYAAYG